ncbi:MAG TPA: dTDP-4-dehydrorhamnose 3,5-epimerase family protein [Candidatus Baltobacteraceae bacterium]
MQTERTTLPGAFRLQCRRSTDARGAFVKYFDAELFRNAGLCDAFAQAAWAENERAGTVRGLHYQANPCEEAKVVRCSRGRIYDVLVDLRADSPAYGQWESFELDSESGIMLYAPPGVAHGYQTLDDRSIVDYLISARFVPDLQRGIHWRSPRLAIAWPLDVSEISERDDGFPAFTCDAG